jgi:hypothetical protein
MTAAAITDFATAFAAIINIAYFGVVTTVLRVQGTPLRCRARHLTVLLARQTVLPLARQRCSVIAGVVVSAVIGFVVDVAGRAFEVSELALPVLDKT